MFTGIIQEVGRVAEIMRQGESARVVIASSAVGQEARLGDSVCSNGVCLTVSSLNPPYFGAELSSETLRRSTFQQAQAGDEVNLEPSLRPTDRLGGHIVSGHVDGVGAIEALREDGDSWQLVIRFPEALAPLVAEKGSLAVDGISLTVAGVDSNTAEFAIVPYTMQQTNLRGKRPGDAVNLEADVLARYVQRMLHGWEGDRTTGLSREKLRQYGYLTE